MTKNQLFAVICVALAVSTFVLYWPTRLNGFTNFDDDGYITNNPHVNTGLTASNIHWAFTHAHAGYWIPLTWISMMLDCQFFGLKAGYHHLMGVFYHIANTLLLFIWLKKLTGAIWRSAFVAALFAWHPLHVESVAWACERKDVLSGFFWMLALISYWHYVKERSLKQYSSATFGYLLGMFFFACGLMSKPMVVTLPFVLLLLDFWPLERFALQDLKFGFRKVVNLFLEKIPFFGLAAAGSVVGLVTQTGGGAVSGNDPLSYRLCNALGSYVRYISKLFWPSDLAVFYPFPSHGVIGFAIVSALLLVICSAAFIFLSRHWPYLFTGWFWYLGTLVPVIGVIQSGSQSMGDRFTYIPSIGFFILITWGLADYFQSRFGKTLLTATAITALVACFVLTSIQVKYWRNNITLFSHARAVTADNYVADACLAEALDSIGQDDDALNLCKESIQINSHYPPAQFFLGMIFWKKGDTKNAYDSFFSAVISQPQNPIFQYNFGRFLMEQGLLDKAAERFTSALNDKPDYAEVYSALGMVFLKQGKLAEAAGELSRAVDLEPANAQFHYDLGTVLLANSQSDKAIAQFLEAVRLKSDLADAHENLAIALASQGKLDEAIEHFSAVAQLQPDNPEAHFNLGLAYLNDHQPARAAAQFSEELRLTPDQTKAHYRLAQALEQQNQPADAVLHYRQALRLTPNFPEAKKELDEILAAHPQLR